VSALKGEEVTCNNYNIFMLWRVLQSGVGQFLKNLINGHIQCFSFWQIMARFLLLKIGSTITKGTLDDILRCFSTRMLALFTH
jgi:hypothetical protein